LFYIIFALEPDSCDVFGLARKIIAEETSYIMLGSVLTSCNCYSYCHVNKLVLQPLFQHNPDEPVSHMFLTTSYITRYGDINT